MEPPFDKLDGVLSTTSGYTGGRLPNPNYTQVSSGGTGHTEAVEIRFDPDRIGYEELLDVFWRNIDPLARNRQFCDSGSQYRSAIFFHDDEQQGAALASKEKLGQSGQFEEPIATEIVAASTFYPAEEYHQDYYTKNPIRYKLYRLGCGRDIRGNWHLWRLDKDDLSEARRNFEAAIALDRKSVMGLGGLALAYSWQVVWGWAEYPDETAALAYRAARDAVAADGFDAWAHYALGQVHLHRRRLVEAERALRRALELNPNFAVAQGTLSGTTRRSSTPKVPPG